MLRNPGTFCSPVKAFDVMHRHLDYDLHGSPVGTTATSVGRAPVPWSARCFQELLTDLQASNEGGQDTAPPVTPSVPVAAPSVVSPDDQHQEQDHSTGKARGKSKHGKKGGKGRKT